MSIRQQKGFSLIELLIVMVILLALLGLATLTVQSLAQQWRTQSTRQSDDFTQYQHLALLAGALQATVPYEVQSKSDYGFYFLGREDGFTGVTENGIYNAGKLSVYRVLKEQASDQTYSLFYEEAPIDQAPLFNAEQELNFNFRVQIAARLNNLSFSYYGWPDSRTRNEAMGAELRNWYPEFDGISRQLQPEKVALLLDQSYWPIMLPDRMDVLKGRRLSNQ